MSSQIVLISGCSSGIGLATAVFLAKEAEKRFKVYATMRNLTKKGQLEEEGKDCLGDRGGGTPLYGLHRYVKPQRVWFLSRFGRK